MFLNASKVINTVDRGNGIYTQYYEDGSYETFCLPRAKGLQILDQGLIDNDVNYYGFLESKEHRDWMESIKGQTLTMDMYDSPYFGMQSSGAYRELDRVYEAFKVSIGADKQVAVDPKESEGFDPDEYEKAVRRTQEEFNKTLEKQLNPGINPMLILAAVAAYFIAG